ncbi:unnamed protein product [Polarella glacialis]|uniref:Uncharacterized protein n=1 Tax=Polarella glacialis TaxID=89957 RepID=A0A813JTL8_POLGL|nr:unnamed protein product [Polarella glacialis]
MPGDGKATVLLKTSRHQAARGKADSDARTSLLLLPNVKAVVHDDDVPTWTSSYSPVASLQHEGHPAIKAPQALNQNCHVGVCRLAVGAPKRSHLQRAPLCTVRLQLIPCQAIFQQPPSSAARRTWRLKLLTTWSRCLPAHPLASLVCKEQLLPV